MVLLPASACRLGAIVLLLAVPAALASCGSDADGNRAAENDAKPTPPAMNAVSAVPMPETMDRAALLDAVRSAASASASGADDGAVQRQLDGRQFEVRVRFGCGGAAPNLRSSDFGWTFDQPKRTLRVRAAPTISSGDKRVAALAPEGTEAVEGFWIPRPWIVSAACPAKPVPAPEQTGEDKQKTAAETVEREPPSPDGGRVGIAEFFGASDARTARRDHRAYESTKVLEEGQVPGSEGFDLVLSGRLRALPDGKVINCTVAAPDAAPDCLVSAAFDQVWIEWPGDGEIVARWGRN